MSDCLFCKIAAGEIPSELIYEDELVLAFSDIAPQAPVHFLVIPREHIVSCADVNDENSGIIAHCFEVISKLAADLKLSSFRVVSNTGEESGQTVFHIHFHVLSGRGMAWPPG